MWTWEAGGGRLLTVMEFLWGVSLMGCVGHGCFWVEP
jgi:hypothetical protein